MLLFYFTFDLSFLYNSNNRAIISHYKAGGITALFIGRGAMTPTGRAAIMAGVITVGGVLANTVLDHNLQSERQAQAQEQAYQSQEKQKDREYQSQEKQKDQEYQAYRQSWNPFKKPPKS